MNYLLDTNVLCELVKPKPSSNVLNFINTLENNSLYISVLTIGEIRKGVGAIADPLRREKILIWLESEVPAYFEDRILNIDLQIADKWGSLQSELKGYVFPAIDALIAATAEAYQLTLITRNIKDFVHAKIPVINPWDK